MTINSKKNCIRDLELRLLRTATWRRELQAKYLNDPRNERAADKLEQLASEASNLTDAAWAELMPFYDWSFGTLVRICFAGGPAR
jgi:hypothetical protein